MNSTTIYLCDVEEAKRVAGFKCSECKRDVEVYSLSSYLSDICPDCAYKQPKGDRNEKA